MTTQTPSFAQLLDWIEGRLSEQDATVVATQVAQANADHETHATIEWLRNFHSLSSGIVLKTPPPRVRRELFQRVKQWKGERQKPTLLQCLLASLSFDSEASLATAGVRAINGLGNQRQIVYSTEVVDIVINTQPGHGGSQLDVLGQVMPAESTNVEFAVQLLHNDAEFRMTQTDDIGEFGFIAVPPGMYSLVFVADLLEIQTPPIELKLN